MNKAWECYILKSSAWRNTSLRAGAWLWVPACHNVVRKQILFDLASEQLNMERIKNPSWGPLSALHLGKQRIPRAYMRYY